MNGETSMSRGRVQQGRQLRLKVLALTVAALLLPAWPAAAQHSDGPATVSFGASHYEVDEPDGGESAAVRLTVSLSHAVGDTVTVNWRTARSDHPRANARNDYLPVSEGVVEIPPGSTEATVEATVLGDDRAEADERFLVRLTGADNAELGRPRFARVDIRDNDPLRITTSGTHRAGGSEIAVAGAPPAGGSVVWPADADVTSASLSFSAPAVGTPDPADSYFAHDPDASVHVELDYVPSAGVEVCLPVSQQLRDAAAEVFSTVALLRSDGSGWAALVGDAGSADQHTACAAAWQLGTFTVGYPQPVAPEEPELPTGRQQIAECPEEDKRIFYSGSFSEDPEDNDGMLGRVTANLCNETFAADLTGQVTHQAAKVPGGMTFEVERVSDHTVTLKLTGAATAHEDSNDRKVFRIQFENGAFVGGDRAEVAGFRKEHRIDFHSAPEVSQARWWGDEVTLEYDRPLDVDVVPWTGRYTVTADGETVAVTQVTVGGEAVRLTLASALETPDLNNPGNTVYPNDVRVSYARTSWYGGQLRSAVGVAAENFSATEAERFEVRPPRRTTLSIDVTHSNNFDEDNDNDVDLTKDIAEDGGSVLVQIRASHDRPARPQDCRFAVDTNLEWCVNHVFEVDTDVTVQFADPPEGMLGATLETHFQLARDNVLSFTFPAGVLSHTHTFNLIPTDDGIHTGDRVIAFSASTAEAHNWVATAGQVLTLVDDDEPTSELSLALDAPTDPVLESTENHHSEVMSEEDVESHTFTVTVSRPDDANKSRAISVPVEFRTAATGGDPATEVCKVDTVTIISEEEGREHSVEAHRVRGGVQRALFGFLADELEVTKRFASCPDDLAEARQQVWAVIGPQDSTDFPVPQVPIDPGDPDAGFMPGPNPVDYEDHGYADSVADAQSVKLERSDIEVWVDGIALASAPTTALADATVDEPATGRLELMPILKADAALTEDLDVQVYAIDGTAVEGPCSTGVNTLKNRDFQFGGTTNWLRIAPSDGADSVSDGKLYNSSGNERTGGYVLRVCADPREIRSVAEAFTLHIDDDSLPAGVRRQGTAGQGEDGDDGDEGEDGDEGSLEVKINDHYVNTEPQFTSTTATRTVPENADAGTAVGAPLTVTGVNGNKDADNDLLYYTIAPTGTFTVSDTGQIRVAADADLDHESDTNQYTVTVSVSDRKDADGNDDTATDDTISVTVTVTNVEEGPQSTHGDAYDLSLSEGLAGGTRFGSPLSAPDPEGDTVTYELSGDDAASFELRLESNRWRFYVADGVTLDYEAPTVDQLKRTYSFQATAKSTGTDGVERAEVIPVEISINDVNEAPTITGPQRYLDESPAEFEIFEFVREGHVVLEDELTATDPDGTPDGTPDIVTFEVEGQAKDLLEIARSGSLKVSKDAEFDASGMDSYEFFVSACDRALCDVIGPFTLRILSGAPVFGEGEPLIRNVPENAAAGTALGIPIPATDPAGGEVTFSLSGDDAASFVIGSQTADDGFAAGQISVAEGAEFDFESTKKVYEFTVTATTAGGLTSEPKTVRVNVTDVDEAPKFVSVPNERNVSESAAANTWVYNFQATDPEGETSLTYSISSAPHQHFIIQSSGRNGTVRVAPNAALNHETTAGYTVIVTVRDSGSNSSSHEFRVNVTDVNEAPEFSGSSRSLSVEEGSGEGTPVGIVSAADPDADDQGELTYSLTGSDRFRFTITDTAQIKVGSGTTLNYEGKKTYSVTVNARDPHGLTDSIPVTINVTDKNEAPRFDAGLDVRFSLTEGTAAGTDVGNRFAASDPDSDSLRWSLHSCNPSETTCGGPAEFTIVTSGSNGGQIRVSSGADLDYEDQKEWVFNVRVRDRFSVSEALSVIKTVTVTLTDVNEAPAFDDPDDVTFSVNEDASSDDVIGDAQTATDPDDGDTFTWTLTGTGNLDFTAEGGQIRVREGRSLDYESRDSYSLTLTVRDAGGLTDTKSVTINVVDVNEAPSFKSNPDTSIDLPEDAMPGQVVGAPFEANDPDSGDALTFELNLCYPEPMLDPGEESDCVPGEVDEFELIDASKGEITVAPGASFDYEGQSVYTFALIVSDSDGLMDALTITVSLTNVNEPPVFHEGPEVVTSAARFIEETVADGDPIGPRFYVNDPDLDDANADLTFTLVASADTGFEDDVDLFALGKDTDNDNIADADLDLLHSANADGFDYDSGTREFRVIVRACDDGGECGDLAVSVQLFNVNDPPVFSSGPNPGMEVTYAENGTGAVATYVVNDPEGAAVHWSLGGADGDLFTITGGVLEFKDAPDFDDPGDDDGDNAYKVSVRAAGGQTISRSLTVNVTNINEMPAFTEGPNSGSSLDYAEAGTHTVATYAAEDPEGVSIFWSVTGADASKFRVPNGVLSFRDAPDYEDPQDANGDNAYQVTVRAAAGGHTVTSDLTVNVTNLDEPGSVSFDDEPVWSIALTASVDDPDGHVVVGSWRWRRSQNGTGNWQVITGETAAVYTPVEADQGYWLEAQATYSDGYGGGRTAVATTGPVASPTDDPVFTGSRPMSVTVPEDAPANRSVALFQATDPDGDDADLMWSLSGDGAANFAIDPTGPTGGITVADGADLDHEHSAKSSFTITVTVLDPLGGRAERELMITVNDVNEPPVITGLDTITYSENGVDPITAYTALDQDETDVDKKPLETSTWLPLSGPDAGDFTFSDGELSFTSPPDYENPADADTDNTYEVTVRASDSGGTTSFAVTVEVLQVNEDGTITFSRTQPQLDNPLTATLDDPDGGVSITGWTWWSADSESGPWNNSSKLSGETGDTVTPGTGTLGNYLRVRARYTDAAGTGNIALAVTGPVVRGYALQLEDGVQELEDDDGTRLNVQGIEHLPDDGSIIWPVDSPDVSYATVTVRAVISAVPDPADFALTHDEATEVDIDVSNVPEDGVTVCLPVSAELMTAAEAADTTPVLLHYDGTDWNELPSQYDGSQVCATVTDFSGFAVGYASSDRDILIALYQATEGWGWARNDHWLSDEPIWKWYGVTTDHEPRNELCLPGTPLPPGSNPDNFNCPDWDPDDDGRVVRLNLNILGLSGELPGQMRGLDELKILELRQNDLSGEIPSALGDLDNLRGLLLDSNQLSGSIPAELGRLSRLKDLRLQGNALTGPLPDELGGLARLEYLDLRHNRLSGALPEELSGMTSLEVLHVAHNSLSGVVPDELNDLPRLWVATLAGNSFHGCLPYRWAGIEEHRRDFGPHGVQEYPSDSRADPGIDEVGLPFCDHPDRAALQAFYHATRGTSWIDNTNWLTGASLNQWHGVRTEHNDPYGRVVALSLDGNNLTGRIPWQLGSLEKLTQLSLGRNALTGSIPWQLGNLDELEFLHLHGNSLSGSLSYRLGDLSDTLVTITLGGDGRYSGCVPKMLWDRSLPQAPDRFQNNDLQHLGLSSCHS